MILGEHPGGQSTAQSLFPKKRQALMIGDAPLSSVMAPPHSG
jgi:hypothetical protein